VPSLVAEISRVRESVTQLSNLTQAQERVQDFEVRREQLAVPERRIQSAVEFLVAARSEQIIVPSAPTALALLKDLAGVRDSFVKDPNLILGASFISLVTRLQEAANALEAIARDAWTAVRAERSSIINQSLLASLESLPGYASTVRELRRLSARAATFGSRSLVSGSELKEFFQITGDLRTQWQALCSPERMPAEVIAFLQACAEGGATLDLLTADVRKWLAHHSLESQFRIRMVPG
jgi:hypothetical protein